MIEYSVCPHYGGAGLQRTSRKHSAAHWSAAGWRAARRAPAQRTPAHPLEEKGYVPMIG
jgi:hypothetical protein